MESLKSNSYQYGVGLRTLTDLFSGRFGAAKVSSMLEQWRADLFMKKVLGLVLPRVATVAPVFRSLWILVCRGPGAHRSPSGWVSSKHLALDLSTITCYLDSVDPQAS